MLARTGQEKNFSPGLDLAYLMTAPEGAMEFVGDCMKAVGRLLYFTLPGLKRGINHHFLSVIESNAPEVIINDN